ncbi:type VI secretion system baseplate subunit TssF, partial [Pseudomonas aeruginosa]
TSLLHDGLDNYLSFGIRLAEQIETLWVELTCTNQNLPQRLRLGDICVACQGTPEILGYRNITPATPSYAPPLNRDILSK